MEIFVLSLRQPGINASLSIMVVWHDFVVCRFCAAFCCGLSVMPVKTFNRLI